MKRVLIIEHAQGRSEGVDDLARVHSMDPVIWQPYLDRFPPDILEFDGLIIGGGPMGAYERYKYPFFEEEVPLIEAAMELPMPILGICLGAQLLASLLGGEVKKTFVRKGFLEVKLTEGAVADPVLCGLAPVFPTFQYHGDEITKLPSQAVHTATSDNCHVEGFRIRGMRISAVQFHPEISKAKARRVLNLVDDSEADAMEHEQMIRSNSPAFNNNALLFSNFFAECRADE